MLGRSWQCNNQCGSDCCSEIFLPLSDMQKETLARGHYFAGPNYTDWKWLGYHPGVKVQKIGIKRKIIPLKEYTIKYNEALGKHMLHMETRCGKLMPDRRCKVYRSRPEVCKKAECIVYSDRPWIRWYGKNGLLKDVPVQDMSSE